MPLLHLLGGLVGHVIGNTIDGVADEGEETEEHDEDNKGEQLGEGGHDLVCLQVKQEAFTGPRLEGLRRWDLWGVFLFLFWSLRR